MMVALLQSSPLLTIFIVVALGSVLGAIPFGPLRLGAAGALFVGLAVGNAVPGVTDSMPIIQGLGLALFVYTVGLNAGQTFFRDAVEQWRLILVAIIILGLSATIIIFGGHSFGFDPAFSVGIFTGATTSTPALAAASALTGSEMTAVGYSLAYPLGVVIGIIAVGMIVGRSWPGKNDTESLAGQSLVAVTVHIDHKIQIRDIPGWKDDRVQLSNLQRGDDHRVVSPGETLLPDDRVVVVGLPDDVERAVASIGSEHHEHLADDHSVVGFRSFVVSSKELAGKSVASLNLSAQFGASISRLARNDMELLASADLHLELGDRVAVVFPREEEDNLEEFFGNSERKIAEVDAIGLGLGIAAGILLGMVKVSLPGGSSFSLGIAVGPLLVGMVLGNAKRTGPLVWQLPLVVNLAVRQLGLLLFLAAVGISSGPAFMKMAFTLQGVKAGVLGAVVAIVVVVLTVLVGWLLRLSAQRTAGAMAGILGQPAILSFATSKVHDERVERGYAVLFALGIIVKIIFIPIIFSL